MRLHVEIMGERIFFVYVRYASSQLRTVHYRRWSNLSGLSEDLGDGVSRAVVEMAVE